MDRSVLLQFKRMQRGLPQAGDVVAGKYVIARLLGRGGMGAVYVVEHRITGKKLALKCLLPEHVEHPEFVERFLREAQAAGRIEHRNVVDVFDVGQDRELIYIVMELLDGKPLSELLRAGQLSLEETLQIMLRAMDGVAAAHAVGIVHRDLKPDNILVCVGQSGRLDDPRVLDFGISKLDDDLSKPLTKSGVMLGTPYYMAFEQINSQRDLDQRVDVYAMGVILYEAMAGQLPYMAESVGALAIRMMSGPPTALSELRPELPDGLASVVMRSVARNRDERYASMRELSDALRPYCSESANLLVPKGQGTPLGSSLRNSRAVDPTLPAMARLDGASHNESSSARLKLDGADHHGGRTPSAPNSSKVLLLVSAAALAIILLGVALLLFVSSPPEAAPLPDTTVTPPGAPAAPPARVVGQPAEAPKSNAKGELQKQHNENAKGEAELPTEASDTPPSEQPATPPVAPPSAAHTKLGKQKAARARARGGVYEPLTEQLNRQQPDVPLSPTAPAAEAPPVEQAQPVAPEAAPAPAPAAEAPPAPAEPPKVESPPQDAPAP